MQSPGGDLRPAVLCQVVGVGWRQPQTVLYTGSGLTGGTWGGGETHCHTGHRLNNTDRCSLKLEHCNDCIGQTTNHPGIDLSLLPMSSSTRFTLILFGKDLSTLVSSSLQCIQTEWARRRERDEWMHQMCRRCSKQIRAASSGTDTQLRIRRRSRKKKHFPPFCKQTCNPWRIKSTSYVED